MWPRRPARKISIYPFKIPIFSGAFGAGNCIKLDNLAFKHEKKSAFGRFNSNYNLPLVRFSIYFFQFSIYLFEIFNLPNTDFQFTFFEISICLFDISNFWKRLIYISEISNLPFWISIYLLEFQFTFLMEQKVNWKSQRLNWKSQKGKLKISKAKLKFQTVNWKSQKVNWKSERVNWKSGKVNWKSQRLNWNFKR